MRGAQSKSDDSAGTAAARKREEATHREKEHGQQQQRSISFEEDNNKKKEKCHSGWSEDTCDKQVEEEQLPPQTFTFKFQSKMTTIPTARIQHNQDRMLLYIAFFFAWGRWYRLFEAGAAAASTTATTSSTCHIATAKKKKNPLPQLSSAASSTA